MDDLTLIAVLSAHARPEVSADIAWEMAETVARDVPRPITRDGLREGCLAVAQMACDKTWGTTSGA